MIKKQPFYGERTLSAYCDCCEVDIMDKYGRLEDHVKIEGYRDGKLLEAVVCIKCVDEKLGFIKIQQYRNTIGDC